MKLYNELYYTPCLFLSNCFIQCHPLFLPVHFPLGTTVIARGYLNQKVYVELVFTVTEVLTSVTHQTANVHKDTIVQKVATLPNHALAVHSLIRRATEIRATVDRAVLAATVILMILLLWRDRVELGTGVS